MPASANLPAPLGVGRGDLHKTGYVCGAGAGGAPGAGLTAGELGAPGVEDPGTFDVQIRMSCIPSL